MYITLPLGTYLCPSYPYTLDASFSAYLRTKVVCLSGPKLHDLERVRLSILVITTHI